MITRSAVGSDARALAHSAEYSALKAEQTSRITPRDHQPWIILGAYALIVVTSFQWGRLLLLGMPIAAWVLCWPYLGHDLKVRGIRGYVREELAPAMESATGVPAGTVFAWERAVPADPRRQARKRIQCNYDLLLWWLIPTAGALTYLTQGPYGVAPVALCLLELAALVVLGAQVISYAGVVPEGRWVTIADQVAAGQFIALVKDLQAGRGGRRQASPSRDHGRGAASGRGDYTRAS